MPFYRMNGATVNIRWSGKLRRNPPLPCCARIAPNEVGKPEVRCCAISSLLCDWPVEGGTCDAPLCDEHGAQVGRDRHLCPIHLAAQRAAEPELF